MAGEESKAGDMEDDIRETGLGAQITSSFIETTVKTKPLEGSE